MHSGGGTLLAKPVITMQVKSSKIGMITTFALYVKCNPPYPTDYFNFETYQKADNTQLSLCSGNKSSSILDGSIHVAHNETPDYFGYENVRICWADQDGNQLSEWSDWATA